MNKVESTKINKHKIRRILVAMFGVFVGICVASVMFGIYDPSQNSLKAMCSVCMDVICIIILLIFISSFVLDDYGLNRATRLFAVLLIATIWAVFLDFLNWAFDGSLEFGHLTFWFTVGSLCMGSVIACVFSIYLSCYMGETHKFEKMRTRAVICSIANVISFILTFVLAITGTAFQFVDGHYETGVLYDAVTVLPILTVLYLIGFLIRHIKTIGARDVFAASGYILLMIAGALIEAAYSIGTTYVGVAIADIFIFVTLQNELIVQEKQNVQKWMKKSNTDELTGFYNRHAYEADLEKIKNGELSDDFVYVSVDVNSLKLVNDSFGHYAGDELLAGAAECLKKCFGQYGKLYRIGGDEFIAMIFVNEEQLNELQTEIEEVTNKWSGNLVQSLAVSCGYAARKELKDKSIDEMAVLADQRMYEAKNAYYRRMGIERRKNNI